MKILSSGFYLIAHKNARGCQAERERLFELALVIILV